MKTYTIWRKPCADNQCNIRWIETAHSVEARTPKEAQSKMRRRFANAGFAHMSLVASIHDPNLMLSKLD